MPANGTLWQRPDRVLPAARVAQPDVAFWHGPSIASPAPGRKPRVRRWAGRLVGCRGRGYNSQATCRRSSAVEQGSHKPRVSGSIPLVGTMSMALNGFAAAFRRHFPDLVGRPVLVALSGGADSVALLCILHEVVGELGCEVAAAHVHHHVRGAAADADARHCEALCARLGVRLAVEHIEPAAPNGVSREAWWRRERYRALEAARERFSCAAVATAHTRDDQAETVLMKLLRGSGPRGVAGVRRRRGAVIRPLLDVPRAELRDYLNERGVAWREDASNADLELPRGRIRHELLPALSAAFPGAPVHLAAFADALARGRGVSRRAAARARGLARDRPPGAARGGGGAPARPWRSAGRWSSPGGCPSPSLPPGASSMRCWRWSRGQVRRRSTSGAGGCCAGAAGHWCCARHRWRRLRPAPSRYRPRWRWRGGSSGGWGWTAHASGATPSRASRGGGGASAGLAAGRSRRAVQRTLGDAPAGGGRRAGRVAAGVARPRGG